MLFWHSCFRSEGFPREICWVSGGGHRGETSSASQHVLLQRSSSSGRDATLPFARGLGTCTSGLHRLPLDQKNFAPDVAKKPPDVFQPLLFAGFAQLFPGVNAGDFGAENCCGRFFYVLVALVENYASQLSLNPLDCFENLSCLLPPPALLNISMQVLLSHFHLLDVPLILPLLCPDFPPTQVTIPTWLINCSALWLGFTLLGRVIHTCGLFQTYKKSWKYFSKYLQNEGLFAKATVNRQDNLWNVGGKQVAWSLHSESRPEENNLKVHFFVPSYKLLCRS